MVIFATGIMAFSASPFVLAATPAPANNTQQAEQVDTTKQDTANQNNTANQNTQAQIPAAGNAQTQTDTSTKFQIRNTCQRDGLYFGLYSLL